MMTAHDSAILMSIIQAATQPAGWPVMLHDMADHLTADHAQLFVGSRGWDQRGPLSVPCPEGLAGLRARRVYTGEELADRAPGFAEGMSDSRAIGLRLSCGLGWLVVLRQRGQFRAMDSAALTGFAPHLEQAWQIAAQFTALTGHAERAETVARRIGVGYVDFDARGLPVARDGVAHDLLARVQYLPSLPRDMGQTALLSIPPDLDLLCQRGPDGGVVGILRARDQSLPPPETLSEALQLTLPEARLVRTLAQGATMAEAADCMGLTLETARYYSKQVYAKTGLRGQSDLMRRIWTSALVLG
jgi:DNA-binding CsgD family transcriptional regulator